MLPFSKVAAIGSGAVAAASAVTWLALAPHAQVVRPPATADEAGNNDDVIVCIGADSVLRTAPADGSCPPNATRIALSGPDHQAKDLTDDNPNPSKTGKPAPSGPRPVEGSPDDIERRLEALEKASLFEVVDKQGAVMFSVAPGRATLYNTQNKVVASLSAIELGGSFTGLSSDGIYEATVGANGSEVGLDIREAGLTRINLGRQPTGNYTLKVERRGGGTLAGIGESRAGTGVLLISDPEGHKRASMQVVEGKGSFGIFNGEGTQLLDATEKSTGGGMLMLGDADGTGVVKMTNNDERYGGVFTGPRSGFPYVPSSGLPGSYFLGCAGGASCRP